MRSAPWLGLLLLASPVVVACTSNDANAGGADAAPTYSLSYCPNASSDISLACAACSSNNCGSQITAANGACAVYLECACPQGVDAAACPEGPTSPTAADGGPNGCPSATLDLESCTLGHCAQQCAGDAASE